jgi:hypothetical protein
VMDDPDVFDPTTLPAEEHQFDFSIYETQANQTQLAAGVGEELLNFNNDQDVATTSASKRKRDDHGDDEDEESPVAKKAATEHSE